MKMMLSALPPPPIVLPKHNPHSSHDNSVDSDNESDTKRNVSRWHHSKMQTPLYGNLARELSSVFHTLSQNDSINPLTSCPSPSLATNDKMGGIVYINRHIAVTIEAASLPLKHLHDFSNINNIHMDKILSQQQDPNNSIEKFSVGRQDKLFSISTAKPYNTMVFPNLPHSYNPRRGRNNAFYNICSSSKIRTVVDSILLAHKNPYLSLADIATNTGIPLFNVLVLKMM
mmetsp:Transcript_5118/g.7409  ORF Transcript_5118/g.7409 Transcript_5118/m.7409 type:complete len:229 (+) Transcript_5118:590-1276(+)